MWWSFELKAGALVAVLIMPYPRQIGPCMIGYERHGDIQVNGD
jgi:hypothetical protein